MTVTLGHLLFQLPATIKSNLRLYESLNFKSIKTHHGIILNHIYIYPNQNTIIIRFAFVYIIHRVNQLPDVCL